MKRLGYIMVALLLLWATGANGQDGVVVHSDPRLAVLVKHPHNPEPIASAVIPHKSAAHHSNIPVVSVKSEKKNLLTASGTKPVTANNNIVAGASSPAAAKPGVTAGSTVIVNSAGAPAKSSPEKINGDDASTTGHAGGWSPPVIRHPHTVYSGKGFRVQIYNGSDRNKAIAIKAEFMRSYPNMRTYLTYVSPCFRVKVGDYRTRNEALGMLREASASYSPCMIVPDLVTISTF